MKALCSKSAYTANYRHNCLVVYRRRMQDWWRRTYWVVCIYCDESHGPHRESDQAWRVAGIFNDERFQPLQRPLPPSVPSLADARRKKDEGK